MAVSLSQLVGISANNILNDQALLDPVSKLRVSNPQALIDTDFEYGQQSAKWESISTVNGVPSYFIKPGSRNPIKLTSFITTAGSREAVLTVDPDQIVIGMPVEILGLLDSRLDDTYTVRRILTKTSFLVRLKVNAISSGEQVTPYTVVNLGQYSQNALIRIRDITSNGTSNILITTEYDHGLVPGISMSIINSQNFIPGVVQANNVNISNVIRITNFATQFNPGETPTLNQANGYLFSQVIPYNWFSDNTMYLGNTAINISGVSNVIETPFAHGFDDVDNYAVYVMVPPSSVITGGNSNLSAGFGAVYWANVVSSTRFCLKPFSRYGTVNATFNNTSSNLVNYPFLFMKNVVEVSQVFANGLIAFRSNHFCQNLDRVVFSNLSSNGFPAQIPLVRVSNNLILNTPNTANLYSYSVYVVDNRNLFLANTVGERPIISFAGGTFAPNPLSNPALASNLFMIRLNQSFNEHNSVYWPNHNIKSNISLLVINSNIAGLPTGNYFAQIVNSNRIRLLRSMNTLNYVDFSNVGNLTVQTTGYDPKGHTFTVPNHGIKNNDQIVYESNGLAAFVGLSNLTAPFVKVLDNNTFRLSPDTTELRIIGYEKYAGNNVLNVFYSNTSTDLQLTQNSMITIDGCDEFPDLNGFYNVWAVVNTVFPPYFRINLASNVSISENSSATFANSAVAYRFFPLYSNGSVGQFHNYNHISTFDGKYQISQVLTNNTLVIDTGQVINDKRYFVDASSFLSLNVATDSFYYPSHSLPDGARVVYDNNGNSNILGLQNNQTYFVSILDANTFRLSNSYESALSQSNIQQLVINQPGVHYFVSNTATGLSPISGTVTSNLSEFPTLLDAGSTFSKFTTSLSIGEKINIVPFSRPYTVTNVFSDSTITVTPPIPSNSMVANSTFSGNTILVSANMYIDPSGYIKHRPFDGGITLTTGTDPFTTITRQTRTYFRYQSGKGLQMSSGTNFNPPNDIESLTTVNSNTIEIRVTNPHGLKQDILTSSNIIVASSNLNGTFPVSSIVDDYRFRLRTSNVGVGTFSGTTVTITNPSVLSNLLTNSYPIGSNVYISDSLTARILSNTTSTITFASDSTLNGQNGSFSFWVAPVLPYTMSGISQYTVQRTTNVIVRIGMFDSQNGMFFECNGGSMFCVRRNSTQQIPGRLAVINSTSNVFGTGTSFTKTVSTGNTIVIRGQTYLVTNIFSDTDLTILPAYRGISANNVIGSIVRELRVPQSQWSLDPCDGTGQSGFNLDITKMQMIYMDYSWYGAGKVRFGFRKQDGKVFYCHEFIHGNIMNEAYLRSGNLPARYELQNNGYVFYQPYVNHWGTSVIMDGSYDDDKAYFFTGDSDTLTFTNGEGLILSNAVLTAGSIIVSNVSTANSFAIRSGIPIDSSRADGIGQGNRFIRFLQPGTRIVTSYSNLITPSTLILQLNKPPLNSNNFTSLTIPGNLPIQNYLPIPLLSVRLAPSVDNSVTGELGARDVINRMQLTMRSCDISVTHESTVSIFLNSDLSYVNWQAMYPPSLAQTYKHQIGDRIIFGIPIFTFRVAGGSTGTPLSTTARNVLTTNIDLDRLAILSNSILGGNGIFPNGPDVLTLCVSPVDTSIIGRNSPYSATVRLSWTESQA